MSDTKNDNAQGLQDNTAPTGPIRLYMRKCCMTYNKRICLAKKLQFLQRFNCTKISVANRLSGINLERMWYKVHVRNCKTTSKLLCLQRILMRIANVRERTRTIIKEGIYLTGYTYKRGMDFLVWVTEWNFPIPSQGQFVSTGQMETTLSEVSFNHK